MSTTLGNVLEPNLREGLSTMFIAELGHSEFKRFARLCMIDASLHIMINTPIP